MGGVSVTIKKIRLELIDLENPFRSSVESPALSMSLLHSKLQEPLIVEGPINGRYILVEGYRRFDSLSRMGTTWVICNVQEVTNEEGRVIKRLRNELHRKKKTGYELERMIEFLLNRGLSEAEIARQVKVSISVIKKHIKSLDVDLDLKEKAEKAKVGKDGITKLYKLPNVSERIKNILCDRFLIKEIFGYHVDSIEKVVKESLFSVLTEESQKRCINEVISQTKFDNDRAKTAVCSEIVSSGIQADLEVNNCVYIESVRLLEKLNQIYKYGFINDLPRNERMNIQSLIYHLVRLTNTPLHWDEFPSTPIKENKNQNKQMNFETRH